MGNGIFLDGDVFEEFWGMVSEFYEGYQSI
jgi:hypothetical protein